MSLRELRLGLSLPWQAGAWVRPNGRRERQLLQLRKSGARQTLLLWTLCSLHSSHVNGYSLASARV